MLHRTAIYAFTWREIRCYIYLIKGLDHWSLQCLIIMTSYLRTASPPISLYLSDSHCAMAHRPLVATFSAYNYKKSRTYDQKFCWQYICCIESTSIKFHFSQNWWRKQRHNFFYLAFCFIMESSLLRKVKSIPMLRTGGVRFLNDYHIVYCCH